MTEDASLKATTVAKQILMEGKRMTLAELTAEVQRRGCRSADDYRTVAHAINSGLKRTLGAKVNERRAAKVEVFGEHHLGCPHNKSQSGHGSFEGPPRPDALQEGWCNVLLTVITTRDGAS